MKKLFNFMLVVLAACGISCTNLGDENNVSGGGNDEGGDNGGNTIVTTTFAIEVSNITPLGAYVSVTPSDNTTTYYFDVVSKEEMGKYVDAKALAKVMISDTKENYEYYGYTLADALSKGADGYSYISGFTPNTEYYALAFGVNADGTITTGVTTEPFTTLEEVVDESMTFDVNVSNITSNGAFVLITPSNNNATYYFDVVTKEKLDEYSDTKEYAEWLIANTKEQYDFYGYPFAWFLSAGIGFELFEAGAIALMPNTEYYAIAFGVTTAGVVTTNVTAVPFKTLEEAGSTSGDKELNSYTYGYYTNYGDYYESNATNWYIDLYPEEGMDFVALEVQTALDATDFTGNYSLASTFEAGTAVAGFVEVVDEESYFCGSLWGVLDSNYDLADYALLASGSVTIGKTGSNYTIAVDAVDADGYKVTVNYEGVLEEYIDEGASLLSVRKKPARRLRFVPKTKSENGALSCRAITKVAESKDSIIKRKLMK